jgi:predicted nucleic acid-binding protein
MIIGIDTTFMVQHDVRNAPHHQWARTCMNESVIGEGNAVSLSPQVLSEYLHIVTDEKRFENPLPMPEAIDRAADWWSLFEAHRIFPDESTLGLFFEWIKRFRLGRKRILDTFLAATYVSHGIRRIISTDAEGFRVFGALEVLHP